MNWHCKHLLFLSNGKGFVATDFISPMGSLEKVATGQWNLMATTFRYTWIAVGEKRTNREKNFRDGESWAPVIFQNVQTDHTLQQQ